MRPMLYDVELTGRARVRPGWFGRLILQVEVRTLTYSACPPMPGVSSAEWRGRMRADGEATTAWRDATWEEVSTGLTLRNWGHEPPRPFHPPAVVP